MKCFAALLVLGSVQFVAGLDQRSVNDTLTEIKKDGRGNLADFLPYGGYSEVLLVSRYVKSMVDKLQLKASEVSEFVSQGGGGILWHTLAAISSQIRKDYIRAQQFQAQIFQILKDLVTKVDFVNDPWNAINESDFQRIVEEVSSIDFTEDPLQFMGYDSVDTNVNFFDESCFKILKSIVDDHISTEVDGDKHSSVDGIKEAVRALKEVFDNYRNGKDLPEKSDIKIRVCTDALRNKSFSTRLILLIIRALSGFDYRVINNEDSRHNTIISTAQGRGNDIHEDKRLLTRKTIFQDNWKGSKYCLDECMAVLTVGKITEHIDDLIRKIDGACRYLPYNKLDKETKEKVGGTLLKALETAIAYKQGERMPDDPKITPEADNSEAILDDLDSNSSVKSLKELESIMKALGVLPMTVEELKDTIRIAGKDVNENDLGKVMSELGKVVSELES